MDIFTLPNVILNRVKFPNAVKVHSTLDPVIRQLSKLYPLWKLEVAYCNSMGESTITGFKVSQDGEKLGLVCTEYTRKGVAITVNNDRIESARQRGNPYKTMSADKAVIMVKKTFGKMNQTERLSKAKDAADRVITRGSNNKNREKIAHERHIADAAIRFATNEGMKFFLDYIHSSLPSLERDELLKHIEAKNILDLEMLTIERVRKNFTAAKTALVIKDAGKYLVKIGDTVSLYDDNTFPHDMRMKLGMLKLVENEQYVSDMGCRVSDEVFVLLVDET